MAKPEWGTKRICQSCSAPFYDLRSDPIVCPKCEAVFDPEAILKSRKIRGVEEVVEAPKKEEPKAEEEAPDSKDKAALGDDEDVLEDSSDLEEEDVNKVVETSDDKEDT